MLLSPLEGSVVVRSRYLLARDKVNWDIFWLHDETLENSARLPTPDLLAIESMEDLQAALEQFKAIADVVEEQSV